MNRQTRIIPPVLLALSVAAGFIFTTEQAFAQRRVLGPTATPQPVAVQASEPEAPAPVVSLPQVTATPAVAEEMVVIAPTGGVPVTPVPAKPKPVAIAVAPAPTPAAAEVLPAKPLQEPAPVPDRVAELATLPSDADVKQEQEKQAELVRMIAAKMQAAAPADDKGPKDLAAASPDEIPLTPYEEEVARISAMTAPALPFRNAPLGEVIRALANYSGMKYIAPPEEGFEDKVSFRITGQNPWQVLKVLSRNYGFDMTYEDSVWTFSRINPAEIITRSYVLRHNIPGSVKGALASSGSDTGSSSSSGSSSSGSSSSSSSSDSSGNGGARIFEVSFEKLIKDLQEILGLPTTGPDAVISKGGSAGAFTPIPATMTQTGAGDVKSPGAKVLFSPETNELLVFATRQGHQRVQAYLNAIDQPQPLIRVDALIVEMQRDPQSFIGLDPSGWARPTFTLGDAGSTTGSTTGSTGGTTGGSANLASTSSGKSLTTPEFDLNRPFSGPNALRLPTGAVLSATDLKFQLNMLQQDSSSRVTQNPKLITRNMQEVSIESVIREPYADSTTSGAGVTAGTSSQTTQIKDIKIGTVIHVLPRILNRGGGKRTVLMDLALEISGKVGVKNVFGQDIPITSTRTYAYSIEIPDGYTLAIGGLDETTLSTAEAKVPLAGDIPLVGYLFKNKTAQNTKRNLIAYITPTIIDPGSDAYHKADTKHFAAPDAYMEQMTDGALRKILAKEEAARKARK